MRHPTITDGGWRQLLHRQSVYLAGEWVEPDNDHPIRVYSPTTAEPIGQAPSASPLMVDHAVQAARAAFQRGDWPRWKPAHRADLLWRLADRLLAREEVYPPLITAEMGSPARFAYGPQITHPIRILHFYAGLGSAASPHLAGPFGETAPGWGYRIVNQPVGVVAAITPWNMPLKTIIMKLAPALLAGCTVIVKPAPQTCLSALALADDLDMVGFPPGVVSVLPCGNQTAETLTRHPGVDKVAFTGSSRTGAQIARNCAPVFRRYSLECGGKSAAVVGESADLDRFIASLPDLALANSGQICSNLTRLVVPEHLAGEVVERVCDLLSRLRIGDPRDPETDIGPLAFQQQRERVEHMIRLARDVGTVAYGGPPPPGPGWWVTPHLVTDAPLSAAINQEEVFGPVLSVQTYRGRDDAVRLANGTRYGLAAGVYADDPEEGNWLAGRMRAGTVHINGSIPDVSAPLGGFGHSGVGRELGLEGLREYLESTVVAAG